MQILGKLFFANQGQKNGTCTTTVSALRKFCQHSYVL